MLNVIMLLVLCFFLIGIVAACYIDEYNEKKSYADKRARVNYQLMELEKAIKELKNIPSRKSFK